MAAVGEMAAGVAHELNNPLTTIAGFVELALEEIPLESRSHEDLSLVLREAQRAHTVVRRLLDFSRHSENYRDRVQVNELVSEALSLVQHFIKTSGVQIRLEYGSGLPPVSVDPNQIKQVLLNLIHNALHAMPTGGSLLLRTEARSNEGRPGISISIQDSGEGISDENLNRIFEPFFTTRPAGKGTGLGLAVSYGIITSHDGVIEVESQVGVGSCFTVWLPASTGEIDV
jgi:two-component system NtrC family sensor kinase